MNCPKCSSEMKIRNGKFGEFYYCPLSTPADSHPTLPVVNFDDSISEEEIQALKVKRESMRVRKFDPCYADINLEKELNKHTLREFGYMTTEMDDFLDVDLGDGNHWSDHRPY